MQPFLGEIRIFSFDKPIPPGWHLCDGSLLPINQNTQLFSILGTTYGGNGQTTFAIPDLRGRTPMHFSKAKKQGSKGGLESVTLAEAAIPKHTHAVTASSANGNVATAQGNVLASAPIYAGPSNLQPINPQTVSTTGGQPHENRQPWLCLAFCIALQGDFPKMS